LPLPEQQQQLVAMSRGGGVGKHLQHVRWLWRAPRRALSAARDLYVRSLTGCAGQLPGDAAFGYPSFAGAPAGFRVDSFASSRRSSGAGDEDLRELIRAASQRRAAEAAAAAHPAAGAELGRLRGVPGHPRRNENSILIIKFPPYKLES